MKTRYLVFTLSLLAANAAQAGVSKLIAPAVTQGKAEIDYSGTRYGDESSSLNNKQTQQLQLQYGFTDNLKLGIVGKAQRKSKDPTELKFYGIDAQYEFTQQEQYWLASAVKAEYARALHDKDVDKFELKALLARSIDKTNLLGNVILGRDLGNNRTSGVNLGAKLQAVQSMNPHINPGLEWHGDFGKINKLGRSDVSEHYVGPIIKGDLFKLAGGKFDYTAGYYWGVSDDAADNAARVQLTYAVKF